MTQVNINLKARFVSSSPNCPVRFWELYDSDEITPLVDSPELKMFDSYADHIAVSTENFNWSKTIYLKNKFMNPTFECNWQCYKNRYPEFSSMNLE